MSVMVSLLRVKINQLIVKFRGLTWKYLTCDISTFWVVWTHFKETNKVTYDTQKFVFYLIKSSRRGQGERSKAHAQDNHRQENSTKSLYSHSEVIDLFFSPLLFLCTHKRIYISCAIWFKVILLDTIKCTVFQGRWLCKSSGQSKNHSTMKAQTSRGKPSLMDWLPVNVLKLCTEKKCEYMS